MPSGGTWTPADVTAPGQRPGFYANILAAAGDVLVGGERGVVALPVTADWGLLDGITTITRESELIAAFGPSTGLGTAYYAIREALRGGAAKVLAFRMAGAAAAKATRILQDATAGTAITVTAKYQGARGNLFRITVVTNAVDGAKKDLQLIENSILLESYTGGTNAELVAAINAGSKYLTAVAGGGTFVTNVSNAPLTGGNSDLTLLTADWTQALAALEPYNFDVFAPVGIVDPTLQATIFAWIKDQRNSGHKIYGVFGADTGESITTAITRAATFNHEGVAYLAWGVTDAEGVVRRAADFTSRIAGLIASKGTDVSLTFQPVTGILGIESSPANASVKSGLIGGLLMITSDGVGHFRIEQGINTLTTLTGTQTTAFKKIRVVRVLDVIFNALIGGLTGTFIGQVENDEDGQASIIASISAFLETLSAARYIKPEYTIVLDPAFTSVGDKLFLLIGIKPIDSIDYIYTSIVVS